MKFIKKSYDQNDNYAKEKIKNYLTSKGHIILVEEENYDHDLITEKDGQTFYFEFEVKRNYQFNNKQDYKFDSVSFLGRKERLHKLNPFFYLILCYETDAVVFAESKDIYKEQYKQILNLKHHERKGNDTMYRVPIEHCRFFSL